MTVTPQFASSVFINCPFDDDFEPLLQAMLFCAVTCGLDPRIATERNDSGEARLSKIVELSKESRYSVHDLSRMRAADAGELARMNMPFELGVDYGLSLADDPDAASKRMLVVATEQYEYQEALSDIAGWDIASHGDTYDGVLRALRRWFASNGLTTKSPSVIEGEYVDFQEWDYERLLAQDWSDDDIRQRTTTELLGAMHGWVRAGRPTTF